MHSLFTIDRRGVSEVIGSIMVFGLLILLLGLVQVTAIPSANEDVEFSHNQRVQDDIQQLASDAVTAARVGGTRTTTVKTGMQYPNRMLFLNPPPVSGTLRVTSAGTLTVENAKAVDPYVADYIDGSQLQYSMATVAYDPAYNEYGTAPTTVYNGFGVYNSHPNGEMTVATAPDFIDGKDVSLLVLRGSYSTSAVGTTSVALHPISSGAEPTLVESEGSNQITLTIPTNLPVEHWEAALQDEMSSGYVDSVTSSGTGQVEVTLKDGVTYRLRGAAVRVGAGASAPPETADPAYLTVTDGDGATVGEGRTHQVTIAVRDKYGNPVAGQLVNASVTPDSVGSLESSTATTGANGKATFRYEAASDVANDTTVTLNASVTVADPSVSTFDTSAARNVSMRLFVANNSVVRASLGTSINPAGGLILKNSTIGSTNCQSNTNCNVTIYFNNTIGEEVSIKAVRYSFYSVDRQGQGTGGTNRDPPEYVNYSNEWYQIRGSFKSADGTINGIDGISMRFYKSKATNDPFKVVKGDFFVYSLRYEVGGQIRTATYFVAPS